MQSAIEGFSGFLHGAALAGWEIAAAREQENGCAEKSDRYLAFVSHSTDASRSEGLCDSASGAKFAGGG